MLHLYKIITKRNILWLLVCIWMVAMHSFSGEPSEISNPKSKTVQQKVEPIIEKAETHFQVKLINKNKLHFYIRKNAHVFLYLILSILLVLAWKASVKNRLKPYYLAWITATGFAMLDEYYQTFVSGRSGEFRDVLVDNIGIVSGITLKYLFVSFMRNRRSVMK